MDPRSGTTKGCLEALHIFLGFLGSVESGTTTHYIFLVRPIRKRHHLFVAFGKKSDSGYHPSEEASCKSASGETEHEYSVSVTVVSHCKAVASNNMLVESCADTFVQYLTTPVLEPTP